MSISFIPQLKMSLPLPLTHLQDQKREKETVPLPLSKNIFSCVNEYFSKMQNIRIIQKNLVYLIGLSKELAFKDELLSQFEYLGQYGRIKKLVVNKNKTYNGNGPNGTSYSCHVTYSSIDESSLAILALDNAVIDNHVFKASYGTTKYCSNFLRNTVCLNKDCLYLHSLANESDILSRNEMNSNKKIFASQHVMAIEISGILTSESKRNYLMNYVSKKDTIFPNASSVYDKDIVHSYIEEHKDNPSIIKETDISKKKKAVSIIGLSKLYEKKEKSRFDFAANNLVEEKKSEIEEEAKKIEIPEKISEFLTQNFVRSCLFKKEKDELSEYYFSMKPKANEAEDRWSSLLSTLNVYSSLENTTQMKTINKSDNIILVSKFNSS